MARICLILEDDSGKPVSDLSVDGILDDLYELYEAAEKILDEGTDEAGVGEEEGEAEETG